MCGTTIVDTHRELIWSLKSWGCYAGSAHPSSAAHGRSGSGASAASPIDMHRSDAGASGDSYPASWPPANHVRTRSRVRHTPFPTLAAAGQLPRCLTTTSVSACAQVLTIDRCVGVLDTESSGLTAGLEVHASHRTFESLYD